MSDPIGLIIEDDENLATLFAEALNRANYQTEVVLDGMQALSKVIELTPDVVVLDLHLPNLSGEDVLKSIRSDPKLEKIIVIVATADARLAEVVREKADLVLIKPIGFNQLRELATRVRPRND